MNRILQEEKMAFVNEKDKRRTIDYERNLVLEYKGTNREKYSTFELNWEGTVINIGGYRNVEEKGDKGRSVNWDLRNVHIPPRLSNDKDQIEKVIKEALTTWGFLYDQTNTKVKINFGKEFSWQLKQGN